MSGEGAGARGRFITFEGGEGTGKSTQARRLANRLRERGLRVVETREPGGTLGAEIVRQAVLTGRVKELGPFAEALLMNAARDDHLSEVIRPAMNKGIWIVCDRFADSTRAYQGALGGLDNALIDAFESAVVGDTWPDLTVILDLDPRIGIERARARTQAVTPGAIDRFEASDIADHQRLRTAFLDIARAEPERCLVVDAGGSEEEISKAVWDGVSNRLLTEPQPGEPTEPVAPNPESIE